MHHELTTGTYYFTAENCECETSVIDAGVHPMAPRYETEITFFRVLSAVNEFDEPASASELRELSQDILDHQPHEIVIEFS